MAVPLIEHEQQWLPLLAPMLPLPVPVPVRIGVRSKTFERPWSVCPWIPRNDALTEPVRESGQAAQQLAEFLNVLHHDAPQEAPENPHRGLGLAERAERTEKQLSDILEADLLAEDQYQPLLRYWRKAVATPEHRGPAQWLHGDLHPGNVTTMEGRLSGVIDWGDLTSGDPACDLGCLWSLFDADRRSEALTILGRDGDTVTRARAWALSIGVVLTLNSSDRPSYAQLGRRYLDEVLSEID